MPEAHLRVVDTLQVQARFQIRGRGARATLELLFQIIEGKVQFQYVHPRLAQ